MCPSRKRTTSIMNNRGFGEVVEVIDGINVVIPESFMFSDGRLKRYAVNLIAKLRAGKIGVKEFYATAE